LARPASDPNTSAVTPGSEADVDAPGDAGFGPDSREQGKSSRPEPGGAVRHPQRSDKTPAEERRERVKDNIEALGGTGLRGVTRAYLAEKSGIRYNTLCRYLKHQPLKTVWEKYLKQSEGKPPPHFDDL
jgi:hypothetical protein